MLLRLLILMLVWPSLVQAQGLAIEIPVEANGATLEKAREAAAAKGQRAAFVKLISTIGHEGADVDPVAVPAEQVRRMIIGHEVAEESFKGGLWKGIMRYRFDPAGISATPAEKKALGAPTGNAILLVPVYQEKGKMLLWEDENRWRHTWSQVAMVQGRDALVLPSGDLNDTQALDGTTARTAGYAQILPLLHRYGAKEALIAEAVLDETAIPPALDVRVRSLTAKASTPIVNDHVVAEAGEKTDQLLLRVARGLAGIVRGGAAGAAVIQKQEEFDAEKTLSVTLPLRELKDWPDTRRRLETVTPPIRVELSALSPAKADLVLHFTGDADRLLKSLNAAELTLQRNGERWLLGNK